MRHYFIFILSFLTLQSIGQEISKSSIPQKLSFTKYSLSSRLDFYPFNKATQIKLISFATRLDSAANQNRPYYKPPKKIFKLPIENNSINYSKVEQVVLLNLKQIDTLSDIIFNTCSRWTITETTPYSCYIPHNAILFIDNENKLLAYIEICFDCRRIKYSEENIQCLELCEFAFEDLKKYFSSLNLKVSMKDFEEDKIR